MTTTAWTRKTTVDPNEVVIEVPSAPPVAATGHAAIPALQRQLRDLLAAAIAAKQQRGREQMLRGLALANWANGGKSEALLLSYRECNQRFNAAAKLEKELAQEIVVTRCKLQMAGLA
jgi:hypothetical protein